MKIRPAISEEAIIISTALNRSKMQFVPPLIEDLGDYFLNPLQLAISIEQNQSQWRVYTENSKILGFLAIDKTTEPPPIFKKQMKNSAYIEIFYVKPLYQEQGIGRKILKDSESELRDQKVEWLWTKTWWGRYRSDDSTKDFLKTYGYDGLMGNYNMMNFLMNNNYKGFWSFPEHTIVIGKYSIRRLSMYFRKNILDPTKSKV